jgi:hypothetical protein
MGRSSTSFKSVILIGVGLSFVPSAQAGETPVPKDLSEAVGRAAARFEAIGDSGFIARGPSYTYLVEATRTVLAPTGSIELGHPELAVTMSLVGANRNAVVVGENQAAGRSNYFIGSDPLQWHTNVAGYSRVRTRGIYPGVDVVHYGNGRQFEYDFVVSAHGDPAQIRLHFQGISGAEIQPDGDLLLLTPAGSLRHKRPRLYQDVNGQRVAVDGRFVSRESDFGFEIGRYDVARELIIDPTLFYGTYIDGVSAGTAVATLPASNGHKFVYVGGQSWGGLPLRNAYQTDVVSPPWGCSCWGWQAFVAKFDVSQSGDASLVYSTYLGATGPGSYSAGVWGLAVNPDGTAIAVGQVGGTFPLVDPLTWQPGSGFIARLSAAGDQLLYSTYFPGLVRAIALDRTGRYNVVGETDSTSLTTTPGALMPTALSSPYQYSCWPTCGTSNAFVAIVDPARSGSSALVYATYLGGSGEDWANAIAIDQAGKLYVTGTTASYDFPIRNGAQTALKGAAHCNDQGGGRSAQDQCGDMFLVKLDPTLIGPAALLYSTYLGVLASGEGVAVDAGGFAYVTGRADASFPTTPGAYQTAAQPDTGQGATGGVFVSKLNPTASGPASLIYATYVGGAGAGANTIAVDAAGQATIVGTAGGNFPVRNDLNLRQFGLFESVNGGQTWIGLNNGANAISSLAIDTTVVPRTFYATSDDGVIKSVDGGMSWSAANQGLPLPVSNLYVDPAAPNVVFASTEAAIYRSIDAGASWHASISLQQFPWLAGAQRRGTGSAIYVGSPQGLYRSLDHGDSWALLAGFQAWAVLVDDTATPAVIYAAACCANGGTTVYSSVDDGHTWSVVLVPGPFGGIGGIAIDRTTSPATLYAAGPSDEQGVFRLSRSHDAGTTWDATDYSVDPPEINQGALGSSALVVDESTRPGTLYLATQRQGVWVSADRGVTWGTVLRSGAYGIEVFVDRPGDNSPAVLYADLGKGAGGDIFITKLNATGTDLVSSAVVGGFHNDGAIGAVIEADGGVYVTGSTNWPNTLPVPNGFATTPSSPERDSNPAFLLAFGPAVTAPLATCSSACDTTLNLYVQSGSLTLTLPNVTAAGTTTVALVDSQTLANFELTDNLGAYDISTTASYSAAGSPIALCFDVPGVNDPTVFNGIRILHLVGGSQMDITTSHDYPNRRVCGTATSLSPFVLVLGPRAPMLTWPAPAPIVYGTPLDNVQLNAMADVPGTFAYSAPAGSILTAGTHTLTAVFTPYDQRRYATGTASVLITVTKATASLTWPAPAPIVLGVPLSSAQLNATANVPGAFTYSPAAVTVLGPGRQTLSVTFAPTDTQDYTNASASVPLMVRYNVCALYDQTKAVKSGATMPVKLTLCDVSGADRSSPSVVVTATALTLVSTSVSGALLDAGNANPDSNFRFDPTLGTSGGYIYNLKTTALATGTYNLSFSITGDTSTYSVQFQVK